MEILGARLKILRNEAGKTQQGMADFLGCQVRHYQLIEAGGSNLPIPKLMKVADYFGVSVDYLLGRTENREINRCPGRGRQRSSPLFWFRPLHRRRALPAIPGPVTCRRGAQRPKASRRGGFQRRPKAFPPPGGEGVTAHAVTDEGSSFPHPSRRMAPKGFRPAGRPAGAQSAPLRRDRRHPVGAASSAAPKAFPPPGGRCHGVCRDG